jgi:SAM-dependent methyltransferase
MSRWATLLGPVLAGALVLAACAGPAASGDAADPAAREPAEPLKRGPAEPLKRGPVSSPWPGYLADFHTRLPGITEAVLRHARAANVDAYDWLADAVPSHATVLDLACGNAPLWTRLNGRTYIGVDVSRAELAAAGQRSTARLIQATAVALPLRDASIDTVTCSMALQILMPLSDVLAEISRVLRPGGKLVATTPAHGPLRAADLPVLAGLLLTLGRPLSYPNDPQLRHLPSALTTAGLRVVADEHRCFRYPLRGRSDADLFLASLYLPDLSEWRRRAARTYLRALARTRISLPVPIRRLTAQRQVAPETRIP